MAELPPPKQTEELPYRPISVAALAGIALGGLFAGMVVISTVLALARGVPVFLPGFKTARLAELPITAKSSESGIVWRAPLHYPALSDTPVSIATAWISPDKHLMKLAFELHAPQGSANGEIRQEGCEGVPVVPASAGY